MWILQISILFFQFIPFIWVTGAVEKCISISIEAIPRQYETYIYHAYVMIFQHFIHQTISLSPAFGEYCILETYNSEYLLSLHQSTNIMHNTLLTILLLFHDDIYNGTQKGEAFYIYSLATVSESFIQSRNHISVTIIIVVQLQKCSNLTNSI